MLNRRQLLVGSGVVAAYATLPHNAAHAIQQPPVNGWPGMPIPPDTFNVGPEAHLNWPGQYTPYNGPENISTSNGVYNFVDFGPAISPVISGTGNVFTGCRFRSNWTDGWNVRLNDTVNMAATQFKFCRFMPSAVSAPPNPPGPSWPSAGTRQNVYGGAASAYMIPKSQSYQYGLKQDAGRFLMQDCDIWGFGNAVVINGRVGQKTIRRCWIHDASHQGSGSTIYHQDGPGHLDGGGCSNVLIEDCTIASLGNTNAIAFQAGTYNNITVRRNFLSGFGFCVDMCHATPANTNLHFEDNVLSTDIGWTYGPLYTDFSANFSKPGCTWLDNRLRVATGTVPGPDAVFAYVPADHNKFVHPSSVLSTTDW